MKRAVIRITGVSPYSQSRYVQEPRKEKETAADYEERNWREQCAAAGVLIDTDPANDMGPPAPAPEPTEATEKETHDV